MAFQCKSSHSSKDACPSTIRHIYHVPMICCSGDVHLKHLCRYKAELCLLGRPCLRWLSQQVPASLLPSQKQVLC